MTEQNIALVVRSKGDRIKEACLFITISITHKNSSATTGGKPRHAQYLRPCEVKFGNQMLLLKQSRHVELRKYLLGLIMEHMLGYFLFSSNKQNEHDWFQSAESNILSSLFLQVAQDHDVWSRDTQVNKLKMHNHHRHSHNPVTVGK